MGSARHLIAAVAVAAYAWWATGLPTFTLASTLAVVGAGVGAMAIGRHAGGPRARPLLRRADIVAWGVLFGALTVWELAAFVQLPRVEHPTLSSLTDALLDTHPARALAFVAWLAGAAGLGRR